MRGDGLDVAREHPRIGSGDIKVDLWMLEETVAHVDKGNPVARGVGIFHFLAKLDLVDENVVAFSVAERGKNLVEQLQRISIGRVFKSIQFENYDVFGSYPFLQKTGNVEVLQKKGLAASSEAGDDFYPAVSSFGKQSLDKMLSREHIFRDRWQLPPLSKTIDGKGQ